MDYHGVKSLLNRYFTRHAGGLERPVFFDIGSTYPELDLVTRSFPAIRAEFDALNRSGHRLPCYHDVDAGEKEISGATAKKWGVFMLDVLGHKPAANRALCPATCRALDQVPNLLQAFFSVLEPGTEKNAGEEEIYNRRLHIKECLVLENKRERSQNANDDAAHHSLQSFVSQRQAISFKIASIVKKML